MATSTSENRTAFRRLHDAGFFLLPNAWDAGSARRLTDAGFSAIASTSAGAAWAAGRQDGELGLDAVLDHLRVLVAATPLPVNADFENGFADEPEAVGRHVALAVGTGIAALSIEDWSGSALYDRGLAVERIRAAREAADAVDPAVLLVGRQENFRVPGMTVSESIERAVAYAAAGADCLFVPVVEDRGAVAELVAAVAPRPVSVVVHDYDDRIAELAALGVRRCSVGGSLARRAWSAVDDAVEVLRQREEQARAVSG